MAGAEDAAGWEKVQKVYHEQSMHFNKKKSAGERAEKGQKIYYEQSMHFEVRRGEGRRGGNPPLKAGLIHSRSRRGEAGRVHRHRQRAAVERRRGPPWRGGEVCRRGGGQILHCRCHGRCRLERGRRGLLLLLPELAVGPEIAVGRIAVGQVTVVGRHGSGCCCCRRAGRTSGGIGRLRGGGGRQPPPPVFFMLGSPLQRRGNEAKKPAVVTRLD